MSSFNNIEFQYCQMQFQPRRFALDISPLKTKYIVYKKLQKPIPVDYHLLKCNSEYFNENDKKYSTSENINLLEEEGEQTDFPPQSIIDFISCCQNQEIEINLSNILFLNYLAQKYKVQKLLSITKEIISQNERQLALDSLLFNLDPCNLQNKQQNTDLDTEKEENIISEHFLEFVNDDRLYLLPTSVLYRIVRKYYKNKKSQKQNNNKNSNNNVNNNNNNDNNNDKNDNNNVNYNDNNDNNNSNNDNNKNNNVNNNDNNNDCIDVDDDVFVNFLCKLFDKRGREASAFLSFLDVKREKIQNLLKLVDGYKDKIDISFMNSSLFETTLELVEEVANLKNSFQQKLDEMKRYGDEIQLKFDEMKRYGEEMKLKFDEIERCNEEMKLKQAQSEIEIKELKAKVERYPPFYQSAKSSEIDDIINKSTALVPIKKDWEIDGTIITMTDNNEKYEVLFSSEHDSNRSGNNLFNGQKEISGLYSCWVTASNDINRFIQINFASPKVANIVSITSRYDCKHQAPTHFEVFGLNEEGQGIPLARFVQSNWKNDELKIFPFKNDIPFISYKIKFYESEISLRIGIAEFNLRQIKK